MKKIEPPIISMLIMLSLLLIVGLHSKSYSAEPSNYIGTDKCRMCHSGVYEEWKSTPHFKIMEAEGLPEKIRGCEACHGTGAPHMKSGGDKSKIVNPVNLGQEEVSGICGQCHFISEQSLGPKKWRVLKPEDWSKSGHFTKGISCFSCHLLHDSGQEKELRIKSQELCFTCHPNMRAKEVQSAHSPTQRGMCTSCHSPHGSQEKYMLVRRSERTCLTCHADKEPKAGVSPHFLGSTRVCLYCHNPHNSENEYLLNKQTLDLCLTCHSKIQPKEGKLVHFPGKEGRCTRCHYSHTSTSENQLKGDPQKICLTCHGVKGEEFRASHGGYPAQQGNCITCHNPHSQAAGKLPADVHYPVKEKLCTTCHSSPQSSEPLKLISEAEKLCFSCHSEIVKRFDQEPYPHYPAKAGLCTKCHDPHASRRKGLLKEKNVCFTCHGKQAQEVRQNYPHSPAAKDKCTTCHKPHAAERKGLLVSGEMNLCKSCHPRETMFTHPIGGATTDPRTGKILTCTSCHNPHGSAYRYILALARNELCRECHKVGE